MGLRARLDFMEKKKFLTLPGIHLRLLGRPSHSLAATRCFIYCIDTVSILADMRKRVRTLFNRFVRENVTENLHLDDILLALS
jgi:hypothetical protein